ncbi:type II restriction endonuclease [Rhizobium leguminosarum]|uniref:type II restriction endonuclease n=1 Tax=Rhizobium TaxID=379 RepID=UPI00103EA4EA|nr:type II restriction endonuclease [Rhizobium leguminosarum]TCA72263.1 type II restriction endonuclease [Rhizobium leguminosarum bv. viciae]
MAISDLTDWMDDFGRPGFIWYAKRLSGNDTLANGSHQAGPYIPKDLLFEIIPSLNRPDILNPDARFELYVDSHPDVRTIRAVWYNNKLHGKTRNETRLTNFGGGQSILLDPDSTGALAVFAFTPETETNDASCHVWVCGGEGTEADLIEERLGPVEPKVPVIWRPGVAEPQADLFAQLPAARTSCWLAPAEIPPDWLITFPTGRQIIEKTISLRSSIGTNVDVRLMRRRTCEFEIFRSIEEASWLPKIREGFNSIDGFLGLANTILQSRKSRAGKSLEYHAGAIFEEEGLLPGANFAHNPVIEGNKRPDFLFPNVEAYTNLAFPSSRLRMLAAKTTCKDRWRQIINEADRIQTKHLLTLQEGVSQAQFNEMTEAGVRLVVPAGLHDSYPETVRPHLLTLEEFIGDVRVA